MYERILVPVDGSDPSNCGLVEAIKLARSHSARLRLVHVVDEHVLDAEYCIGTYPGNVAEYFREAGRKLLLEGVALVKQSGVEADGIAVESVNGNIAPLIVAQAKEWGANLIVMGTHGRQGLKRLAMGSDAENVVRQTHIPVLLVHGVPAGAAATRETKRNPVPPNLTVYA